MALQRVRAELAAQEPQAAQAALASCLRLPAERGHISLITTAHALAAAGEAAAAEVAEAGANGGHILVTAKAVAVVTAASSTEAVGQSAQQAVRAARAARAPLGQTGRPVPSRRQLAVSPKQSLAGQAARAAPPARQGRLSISGV
jgi:hypothetical protein